MVKMSPSCSSVRMKSILIPYYLNSDFLTKFLKFYLRQRLGEDVSKLFLCSDEVNLDKPSIYTLLNVMEPDLYVLASVVQNRILIREIVALLST